MAATDTAAIKLYKNSDSDKRVGINVLKTTSSLGYNLQVNGTANISGALSAGSLSLTIALPVNQGGTGATTPDGARNNLGAAPTNHTHNEAKEYIQTIDLTSNSTTTWYPVCIQIPYNGLRRVACIVQLNSGSVPSWSSHTAGFTAVVEMLVTAGGWGTTHAYSICLTNDQIFLKDGEPNPVGYSQFTNSSRACFWCRGGAKYRLLTDWIGTWTVYTSSTTVSSQTIAPVTSYPGLSFINSTIISTISHINLADTTGSGTSYYIPFATGYSGPQTLRANDHFYIYDTASETWINSGKSGRKGGVTLWNGSYYNNLTPNGSLTANRTITFPNATGTVSLEGHSHAASDITSGTLAVARGGTGGATAAAARGNLGAMGATSANGYYGMVRPDGTDSDWIRTTTLGLIPYQSGGSGSGHCGLGTSTWYFSYAYIDSIYTTSGSTGFKCRNISYGTGDPSGGSDGDVYIKYV